MPAMKDGWSAPLSAQWINFSLRFSLVFYGFPVDLGHILRLTWEKKSQSPRTVGSFRFLRKLALVDLGALFGGRRFTKRSTRRFRS